MPSKTELNLPKLTCETDHFRQKMKEISGPGCNLHITVLIEVENADIAREPKSIPGGFRRLNLISSLSTGICIAGDGIV